MGNFVSSKCSCYSSSGNPPYIKLSGGGGVLLPLFPSVPCRHVSQRYPTLHKDHVAYIYTLKIKITRQRDHEENWWYAVRCPLTIWTLTYHRPIVYGHPLWRRHSIRDKPGEFPYQEYPIHWKQSKSWGRLCTPSLFRPFTDFQTSRDWSLYKAVWSALYRKGELKVNSPQCRQKETGVIDRWPNVGHHQHEEMNNNFNVFIVHSI